VTLQFAPTVEAPARTTLRVLNDFILIRPDPEKQKGVIWLPNNIDPNKRWRTGVIVSMGEGMKVNGRGTVRYGKRVYPWKGAVDALGYNRWTMPRVQVGQRVLYLVWSVTVVMIDKVEHHLVRDTAIEGAFE
jgi:co-chaperonin GroES (HSP10)